MSRFSLTKLESPLMWPVWRFWGVAIMPIRLWQWTSEGAWCWTMEGTREPFAFRLGVAWAIWRARYWDEQQSPGVLPTAPNERSPRC